MASDYDETSDDGKTYGKTFVDKFLNDLDEPCTLSVKDNQLMTSSNEAAATFISFENHTVH